MNVNESGDVYAGRPRVKTIYLITGSCPMNLVTFIMHINEKELVADLSIISGWAFMIAILYVR